MKKVALLVALGVVSMISFTLGRITAGPRPGPAKTLAAKSDERAALSTNSQARAGLALEGKPASITASMTALNRGFAAAQMSLEEALRQIESLPNSERVPFVAGIFSFAAKNLPPAEGLKLSKSLPSDLKQTAWRTLVGEWIYARSPLAEDQRSKMRDSAFTSSGSRQGLLVDLSSALAGAKADPELAGAWLDGFSDSTARSEMLATLVSAFPRENPDAYFQRAEGWTDWEKERVDRRFLFTWAYENGPDAWAWYQNENGRFNTDLSSSVFNGWANHDPDGAQKLLETVSDPAQRETLLNIIGRTLSMKNTEAAVTWADGLADPRERAAAQKGVYDGAPRGVGAVLDFNDGFPTLRGIVPGSPLEGTGIKTGDRLVEVRAPDGSAQTLYGADMQTTVNLIRGEPGSQMTLRILRQNGESGALEEHLIPVTRAQLYLNERTIPKP